MTLPEASRNDLFELLAGLPECETEEDRASIFHAMEEILAQTPIGVRPLDPPLPVDRLKARMERVAKRIRELRTEAKMNQEELAAKSGLTQSHISRLERAEHSPTHLTLEKIANALGCTVEGIEPASD